LQELELEEFVTHEMGFDEINSAFELLTQGKCLRCILWMDGAKEKKLKESGRLTG
jgi:S-(hydroxymethyl)glutathione dehydrogenase/alcohol dehydrogenase